MSTISDNMNFDQFFGQADENPRVIFYTDYNTDQELGNWLPQVPLSVMTDPSSGALVKVELATDADGEYAKQVATGSGWSAEFNDIIPVLKFRPDPSNRVLVNETDLSTFSGFGDWKIINWSIEKRVINFLGTEKLMLCDLIEWQKGSDTPVTTVYGWDPYKGCGC